KQFNKAKKLYTEGEYKAAESRLQRVIGILSEKGLEDKQILGNCYLLLGAVCEKQQNAGPAEENYKIAKERYGVESIKNLDFSSLAIYNKAFKKPTPPTNGHIVKEGKKKKKRRKKFPWLIVAGGVVVVVAAVILLTKKKKKYDLTVSHTAGVSGSPTAGTHSFKKGTVADYSYSLLDGYTNLEVLVDGQAVSHSGSIKMNGTHRLEARATANQVDISVTSERIEVVEGGTASFGVVLTSQPAGELQVTAANVSGDGDIAIQSGSQLIFTTENWSTSQTVELQAAEDADTANGEAVVRLSATGLNDKDITVIEQDNDALNFILDREELSIPEGGTASFSVKLSAQPSANVESNVQRVSGDNDIRLLSGSSPTFTPANWDTYQTVTLQAGNDSDTENGRATFRVGADNIASKEITAVEADNDSLGFVTDVNVVSVQEGGSASFQVKLSAQPAGETSISVQISDGDSDISVQSGSSLTFSTSNWNTFQTVTLEAGEDADISNGRATVRISSGGLPDKDIQALEIDNDSINFVTDRNEITVGEGTTAQFQARLSIQPSSTVTVTVARLNGDTDIDILSGAYLTFSPENWDTYQTVTIQASEDSDTTDGEAVIRLSADGVENKDITARENDNDNLSMVVDPMELSIPEGKTASFLVRLSSEPSSNISIDIERISGDSDIGILSGSNLIFTSSNWNVFQVITLQAAEDNDTVNGHAVMRVSSPGIASIDVPISEIDNDSLAFVSDDESVTIAEGGSETFRVRLSSQPETAVTANVNRISGDSDITVSSGDTLTFTTSNWNSYQTVTLQAAEDVDTEDGDAVIRVSASGIASKDISATETDNDTMEFVTDVETLVIVEGGTAVFQVRLSAAPVSDVVVGISRTAGDEDISVQAGSTLTFTSANWDTYREVQLAAAEDADSDNGEATISISASGITQASVTATEQDND
ncbi:MAG: tetratricopeptide repeat protein, partial [bacterium]|nr:tetratricopeptide repeat protein [bacterium]